MRRHIEWCKTLLVGIELMIFGIFIMVFVSLLEGHIEGLVALITGVFSLASISYGFYYWKAKNENIQKISKSLSEAEVEKVLRIAAKLWGSDYDNERD